MACEETSMDITVIGTGYVGLVTGTCFAEVGNTVTCVDLDEEKIQNLKQGIVPIYEPGIESLIEYNMNEGRLRFTSSLEEAAATCNIFFIAVGTPPGDDGSADLSFVLSAARDIGRLISDYAVIVDKSTVPVGAADHVSAAVEEELQARGLQVDVDVVSNPEFLKEGAAIDDFLKPGRIIVGTDSDRAREVMRELYAPFTRNHERIIYMSPRDAEMTKYAANSMLATKISFMNEIAILCERLRVDVENVRLGIGSDPRIGYSFIYPGCGYGGSCFPKDIDALIHMSEAQGYTPLVLNAVRERNREQKKVLFEKITTKFSDDLTGKFFGLWGLSFKPGTDDMREAPSIVLLRDLIERGATVKAYDPAAMDTARRELPREWFEQGRLVLKEHQYEAVEDVDALVLVTEWKSFRRPDFNRIISLLKSPVIFDGRNQYEPHVMRRYGFEYHGIGR
jgi:UDPglucose 6-dehydrogenase